MPHDRRKNLTAGSRPISIEGESGDGSSHADKASVSPSPCVTLFLEVDTNVKTRVVPIRVMVAAPTAVTVHARNIPVDLPAVLATPRGIVIDSGAISFQAPLAVGPAVREGGLSRRQRECNPQSRTENEANDLCFHSVPPSKIN